MAFLQFKRQGVDLATIEVGMGGRLDATNVVEPLVTVITSIGLDHCVELGATFEEIAREKAGIIKPGRPIVLGRVPLVAEQVIRAIAAERGRWYIPCAKFLGRIWIGIPRPIWLVIISAGMRLRRRW